MRAITTGGAQHLSAQEVDVAKPEAERLTLTEPTASGDDADTSVPLGQGIDHSLHLLDRPWLDLALLPLRELHRPGPARVLAAALSAHQPAALGGDGSADIAEHCAHHAEVRWWSSTPMRVISIFGS